MGKVFWITLISLGGMLLTCSALAEDSDEVRESMRALYNAINSGDAAAYAELILPGMSQFPRTGGLLQSHSPSPEAARERVQRAFDAGLTFDLELHHLETRVAGNMAVATYYTTGPTIYPDGSRREGTFRGSMIWVKLSGNWKLAHIHMSRLETE